jgi:flagellar FliL protein
MAEDENQPQNQDEAAGEGSASGPGKRRKKLILLAVLGTVLVAGIGVAVALFLSGGSGSSEETTVTADRAMEEGEGGASSADGPPAEQGDQGSDGTAAEKTDEGSGQRAAKQGDSGPSKADLGIDFGDTFKMKTFHLNLGNALENRYVRLEITLEYSGGDTQRKEIEARLPQLRDAVISVVTRKTREFILAPDGKDALRKEILIRINRYMKTKIDTVYITDILIE